MKSIKLPIPQNPTVQNFNKPKKEDSHLQYGNSEKY